MHIKVLTILVPSLVVLISYVASKGIIQQTQNCPDGWELRKGSNSCYYWEHNNFETYASAQQECWLQNSDLLVINDPDEQDWVNVESELSSVYPTDGWFIGLQKSAKSGMWQWISATPAVSNINWNHEPDDYDNQDCGATNQYFRFSDNTCTNKYGYICQFTVAQGASCPADTTKVKHWFSVNNLCYYVSDPLDNSDRYTWMDAKTKCKSLNAAAQLLSIKSFIQEAFVKSILPNTSPDVRVPWWTGLNDRTYEGKYVWQDGTAVNQSFFSWDQAPSKDSSEKQNCGIMYAGGVIDDAKCSRKAYYVCEKSAIQDYANFGCGPWKRGGNKCYLFGNGATYSRNDARTKCLKAGGDLVKIDNHDEMYWLNHMKIGGGNFWTGLTDAAKEGTWLWADGTSSDSKYINWNREPNNYASNEDCAVIGQDGVYNDMNCDALEGYICEFQRVSGNVIVSTSCPTGWVSNGNSCYYFSNITSKDFMRWVDVNKKCNDLVQDQGLTASYLAVDTADERNFIELHLSKLKAGYRGWWTGLNDRTNEGVWLFYGETMGLPDASLIPWNDEPNNAGGKENCAVLYEGGRFNDLPCDTKAYYICEKPVAGLSIGSEASELRSGVFAIIISLMIVKLLER